MVRARPVKAILFFLVAILATGSMSVAQVIKNDSTSNWLRSVKAGFNLNQASFSSNWKAGGVNSVGFNALFNLKANYKKGKTSWDNEVDLLYGMVNNQGQGQRKTLDRIFLDSKVGHSLSSKWDLIISANLQTQFAPGYKYGTDSLGRETKQLISDYFAPAFITAALGFEYHPADYFKVRLSPLAPRATIVGTAQRFVTADDPKPYGLDPSKTVRYEWYAFQMLAEFNKEIAKNITLKWRYVMFTNYQTLQYNKIDHRLDLNITGKVNKYINVSLGGILLYDYDQGPKVQLSQAFSLGVLFNAQNFQEKK